MKNLHAIRCQDGWLVEVTTKVTVPTKSDVYKIIKQEGLKKYPEIVEGQIYAD